MCSFDMIEALRVRAACINTGEGNIDLGGALTSGGS